MLADILSSLLDLLADIAAMIWKRPAWRRAAGMLLLILAAGIGLTMLL